MIEAEKESLWFKRNTWTYYWMWIIANALIATSYSIVNINIAGKKENKSAGSIGEE